MLDNVIEDPMEVPRDVGDDVLDQFRVLATIRKFDVDG
jgi:hypothetical protein